MSAPVPLLNGVRHDWASFEATVNGRRFSGFLELNYSYKLEPTVVYGAGAQPIGYTTGKAEYEGDFTMLAQDFEELMELMGEGAMITQFDIVANYTPVGEGMTPLTDTLQGCRITSIDSSASQGSGDALSIKTPIKILRILKNGRQLGPSEISAA